MHPNEVCTSRKVCNIHFHSSATKSLKHLTNDVIPSLHLPELLNIDTPGTSQVSKILPSPLATSVEVCPGFQPLNALSEIESQEVLEHTGCTTPKRKHKLLQDCRVIRVKQLSPRRNV